MKIKEYLNKYNSIIDTIRSFNIKTVDKIKSLIFGYGISLIIFISPIIILFHCFIYTNIIYLIVILLMLLFVGYFYLSNLLYYKFLSYYCNEINKDDLKYINVVNIFIYLIMFAFMILVYFICVLLM